MNDEFAWMKLSEVKGLGKKSLNIIYRKISSNNISVNEIFEMSENEFYSIFNEFGKGKFSKLKFDNFHDNDDSSLIEKYNFIKENNINIIPISDNRYPETLKRNLKFNAPPILYCKGYINLLNTPNIAVIGSRKTEPELLNKTSLFSSELAKNGFNIVSGYAKGVDTSAHLGALESDGTTTVVLSEGLKNLRIKKEFNQHKWQLNTLFISQFQPFEKWRGRNAMQRNKVVTAISDAVIVIESGEERDSKGRMSGTFHAAKSALEVGVPLFVLNPTNNNKSKGNEDLIKIGGIKFDAVNEIIEKLKTINSKPKVAEQLSLI